MQEKLGICILFEPPEMKLRQGNAFTSVYHSVHKDDLCPGQCLCPGECLSRVSLSRGSLSSGGGLCPPPIWLHVGSMHPLQTLFLDMNVDFNSSQHFGSSLDDVISNA